MLKSFRNNNGLWKKVQFFNFFLISKSHLVTFSIICYRKVIRNCYSERGHLVIGDVPKCIVGLSLHSQQSGIHFWLLPGLLPSVMQLFLRKSHDGPMTLTAKGHVNQHQCQHQYVLVLEQAHIISCPSFIEFQTVKFEHVSSSTFAQLFQVLA